MYQLNNLIPNETYQSFDDIDIAHLQKLGIEGTLFDFNGTLVKNGNFSMDTLHFINKLKQANIEIGIITNNPYLSGKILDSLHIFHYKKFACKPLKRSFILMSEKMKTSPSHIAVFGNNRLIDIFGANRAGMYSIWMENLDSFLTQVKKRVSITIKGFKSDSNRHYTLEDSLLFQAETSQTQENNNLER